MQEKDALYIAIDLGAGSGRVFLAGVAPGELLLEEIRRFHYPPTLRDGHLRWDLPLIISEIEAGLRAVGKRARELGRAIHSIGVDSWGVDYGLLDSEGHLLEDPVCYRDDRTLEVMPRVFEVVPRPDIFRSTGIQFLSFNTIYQLFAHQQEGLPEEAERLLLMPDLINFRLTGRAVTEYTNVTTTQLIDAHSRSWDESLIARLDLPRRLFTEIVSAGETIGPLKPELARALDLEGVQVIAPATHDTGSAVAGTPLEEGWAYISSGTWSLVGVELDRPLIDDQVAHHNFTNEGGAFGTIRFLKNVMGLWVLESCRRQWREQGIDVDYDTLLGEVAARSDFPALLFPDDSRFFNPPSMLAAIEEQAAETGQKLGHEPAAIAKAILDSLALRYASVLRTIESMTGREIHGIQIVGGGSLNGYLNQATANAAGKPVIAGPAEATVIGNVLIQAVAAGRFETLSEARRHVAASLQLRRFAPQSSRDWDAAGKRYAAIESRYLQG